MRNLLTTAKAASLLAGGTVFALCSTGALADDVQPFLRPNSLVISSSTYDRSQGDVASRIATMRDSALNHTPSSIERARHGTHHHRPESEGRMRLLRVGTIMRQRLNPYAVSPKTM